MVLLCVGAASPVWAADDKKEDAAKLKEYQVGGPSREISGTRPTVTIDRPVMDTGMGFTKPDLSVAPPPTLPATIPAVLPPGVRPPPRTSATPPPVTRAPATAPVATQAASQAATQAARPAVPPPAATRPASTPAGAGTGPAVGAGGDPVPVKLQPPDYPREAAMAGTEGQVVVEFTVTTTGDTEDITIVEAQPRNTFDRAARNAVMRWKFQPLPQAKRIRRTISFTL
jgi:protein TonB